jgi:hypothetical protein
VTDFLKLTQEAYDASTSFFETNHRDDLAYSLRAFRNEHATNSKYSSPEYQARSHLFRPKTRSIIRKNEAAAMQVAFSNREMVYTEAGNPDDPFSVAAAAALKEVLEFRLRKTIPTFEIYLGGIQDAQASGAVCSYNHWEYEQRNGKTVRDRPWIDLRPLENLRFDQSAHWIDVVNTTPYWCDIVPMTVSAVRAMMKTEDPKTKQPKWKTFEDSVILKAKPEYIEAIHSNRNGNKQDPNKDKEGVKDFDIVWVMRWFMRDSQNNDYFYYTLGTEELLTKEVPLEEAYFHNERPYTLGYAVLETHKALKPSMPTLIKPLQQEVNDVTNQRLDNVKFVLNKRWLVARGRQVDVQSLVRNVPGGVTLLTDPKNDIVESNWADVTSSSYVEQDRLSAELDDLAGNFSPSTKVANNAVNDTLGGSKLAAAGAGLMAEYLIRTINETWWEKTIRQLALLEQHYETDQVILAVCAKKAKLFPKFGISQINDDLMAQEVLVNVDMAMGNPNERLQKFLLATNSAIQLIAQAPPTANVPEMIKEIYSNAGYRDGERFWGAQDPRLGKAMQMIQQLQGALQGKQMEIQAGLQETQMKNASNEKIKGAEIQVNASRIAGEQRIKEVANQIEAGRLQLDQFIAKLEASGVEKEQISKLVEFSQQMKLAEMKLTEQHIKNQGAAMNLLASMNEPAA